MKSPKGLKKLKMLGACLNEKNKISKSRSNQNNDAPLKQSKRENKINMMKRKNIERHNESSQYPKSLIP